MKAVTLLVTTRTMGFCAAQIYFQSSAQRNPVYCNIYAFYRVNLAMFEAKLYAVRKIQEAPIQHADEVYEVPTRPEFQQVTNCQCLSGPSWSRSSSCSPRNRGRRVFCSSSRSRSPNKKRCINTTVRESSTLKSTRNSFSTCRPSNTSSSP
jgi:hypothetical protein